MLNNPIGVYLYLILRNDISWRLLNDKEKKVIKHANYMHNNFRSDYTSPEKYGAERMPAGENWDSYEFNECISGRGIKGAFLHEALSRYNPSSVLEIGPGAGYYSRMICDHSSVSSYSIVDINCIFAEYIGDCIKKNFPDDKISYNSYIGDASDIEYEQSFDMIVVFSAVHHIPDREILFKNFKKHLSDRGVIIAVDPSHYLRRIIQIAHKFFKRGYFKKEYYMHRNNLSTHHMCSVGEYKKILLNIGGLVLEKIQFNKNKLINIPLLKKHLSSQIGVVIKRF